MVLPSSVLPDLAADKTQWRDWARERRRELLNADALPAISAAICAALLDFLDEHHLTRGVLAYHALPGEPDISALQDVVPLFTTRAVFRPTPSLTLHAWHSATERSRFGAMQPPRGSPEVPLTAISAVLLPGLAFDVQGRRLGYGGGFYDRLLQNWDVPTIGVTPAALLLPQVPAEAHDVPLNYVATEVGVRAAERTAQSS
ncbi:5-formyltetrahydrofolate cyclo-ligase [Deinococcus sp. KNUC1210]|uniref:5-formyltetrahydrofolate cyclo-ligase n=1 Tax=Deinococcus sp. KNUC1210 TaxID=2917691 RepID=UPI001EEFE0A5|nr:5-formyltetrahydrofolate cyclo-ligase [Deinococcus sp. KNUC1210]ULH14581.1 5-formyltetrahydrofolate cyclo-ligase [Deinococcus sp. KNUC1210]